MEPVIDEKAISDTVKGLIEHTSQSERLRLMRNVPDSVFAAIYMNKDLFSEAVQKVLERVYLEKADPSSASLQPIPVNNTHIAKGSVPLQGGKRRNQTRHKRRFKARTHKTKRGIRR